MKLENFALEGYSATAILFGLGHHWDLRAFAELERFLYEPPERRAVVQWRAADMRNPWGSPGNRAPGCRLVFDGVTFLRVEGGEDALLAETARLVDVSRVVLDETAYRSKERWEEQDAFRLLLRFEGGGAIELGSETVALEAIEAHP